MMKVASLIGIFASLAGMAALGAPPARPQSEIAPDHFESAGVEPFAKAKANGRIEAKAGVLRVNQESDQPMQRAHHGLKCLFVCAGDQARKNPDFLAVVNFDEDSSDYGREIDQAPLPEPGATGNEFHHIGLSADGKVVACGGLLSVLKGQKEVFCWDVANPTAPKFITSADPPLSAITDEFYALPEGGFLVTMMGGATGHAPGRVAEFDRQLNLL
jgi:56kDa selenium binding protein (SBP56)